MQEITKVITPAEDDSLISMYYARLGLNMQNSTDATVDEQIEMFIRWVSNEISTTCNRTFAREKVEETYRDIAEFATKIWVSHYPIAEIESVTEDGEALEEDVDYEVDKKNGVLLRLDGSAWIEPVVVTYTGGYRLPFEAPEALQQAAILQIREAYFATVRGDATIRMVSHKEARVIYFDPAQQARALMGGGAGGAGGLTPARRASADLLKRYTRFFI